MESRIARQSEIISSITTIKGSPGPGSQISLISENAVQRLGLQRRRYNASVSGIGSSASQSKGLVSIDCQSIYGDYNFTTEALVLSRVASNLPSVQFKKQSWPHLQHLQLADPEYNVSKPIDLLLDVSIYSQIIMDGLIKGPSQAPIAQQTALGWILSGNVRTFNCHIVTNNISDLSKYWEIEDVEPSSSSSLTSEEQYCEEFYQQTTRRLDTGRYEVGIPMKPEYENQLGSSKSKAIAQFKQLERKMCNNLLFSESYKSFMSEYQQLGHMCKADNVDESKPAFYLPHHGVIKLDSTTTKLRVVFNASSKSSSASTLRQSFYMDDLLGGTNTINQARELQHQLIEMLKGAGMNLRKWSSNDPELLKDLSSDQLNSPFDFKCSESKKTLGLRWNPSTDTFSFQNPVQCRNQCVTKRQLLSEISKLFDPLGWLSPLSIRAKLLFQNAWSLKLSWDENVPQSIQDDWIHLRSDLNLIDQFIIPRYIGNTNQLYQIHAFCDASDKAYACAVYVVSKDHKGECISRLAVAKTKLAPLAKKVSLPRLELCGALLLAQLIKKVMESLSNENVEIYAWTDSMIVLGWIQGDVHRWKQFVANRIITITNIVPSSCWHHFINSYCKIVAWISRFIKRSRGKHTGGTEFLTSAELHNALHLIIQNYQLYEFHEDIQFINQKGYVHPKSKISCLNPFLDEDSILRVGGRLKNACIKDSSKHPIILSSHSRLTDLIIHQAHMTTLHGGPRLTLAYIRDKYWIISGIRTVKRRLRSCVKCQRFNQSKYNQIMADLPQPRVTPSRPFTHTGVDFTGHVELKANKGRGIKTVKGYIAVFVCLSKIKPASWNPNSTFYAVMKTS
ncbi:hypothetical protein HF086_017176 [Spodoptera exigua]|uniref:Integrase zinc-binding domain-containing protein n=1 Tax=Spodoptera exigua TaxID=7107 RepID=A0A922MJS6_SPOEX|nr:hypothetical protein HF086_017176 [Spodoptera exigua]